ncbi:Assimilatory nitrate reductase electron transfer subunit [Pelotomaculum propionicicum]|uniref:Assimilatory nitrate reductase electron transfer subunit n=1 Tax=Pelotomaculum propionicicum TaxID=258475 RepID=A0A4Y7RLI1_9FIRM|nr:Assimilatory nitrate reductase electron transfer subunit [Pelotomaculum propionicicum]
MKVVIVGNSAAGIAAAENLRSLEPLAEITVLSQENHPSYSRCLIAEIVAGAVFDSIRYRPDSFFEERNINLIRGVRVHSVNHASSTVSFGEEKEASYDKLLVATGSRPVRLGVAGEELDGVFVLRSYDQAELISRCAAAANDAVVIGGGLVGLKAAYALRRRGLPVTVLVKSSHLLTRQLDALSAAMVEKELREAGISFIYGQNPVGFKCGADPKALGFVVLEDGREIPAGLALVAKGVSPNAELVREAGGEISSGIKVNAFMETSLPNVYAAGDCIEVTDCVTGRQTPSALWTLAVEQGRYAAINMAGRQKAYPDPLTRLNAAQFGRLPFVSVGAMEEGEEFLTWQKEGRVYQKLAIREDRLVGFIMVGLIEQAGVFTSLIKSKRPLGNLRGDFLQGKVSAANLI